MVLGAQWKALALTCPVPSSLPPSTPTFASTSSPSRSGVAAPGFQRSSSLTGSLHTVYTSLSVTSTPFTVLPQWSQVAAKQEIGGTMAVQLLQQQGLIMSGKRVSLQKSHGKDYKWPANSPLQHHLRGGRSGAQRVSPCHPAVFPSLAHAAAVCFLMAPLPAGC